MDKQDWYDMGTQIGDLVQAAIDSNDFRQLNQSITDTINDTVDLVQRSIQDGKKRTAYEQAREQRDRARESGWQRTVSRSSSEWREKRWSVSAQKTSNTQEWDVKKHNAENRKLPVKSAGGYKGITYMAVGYSFMGIFGVTAAMLMGLSAAWEGFSVMATVFLCLSGGFLGMGVRGSRINARQKRQKQYLRIVGDREVCQLEELAAGTGKTKKYVAKDLKEMIRNGMFRNGAYLDEQETCLMTSPQAYHQYQDTMKQYQQKKAVEERRKAEQSADSLSDEQKDMLREGQEFIAHIHACNEDIPDREMSEKLQRLENAVTRIFDQMTKTPDSTPDLHKMMSYYLPITRKLVDVYRNMDMQQVEGENVKKTKKEIEDSLDTINTAFENLLDSFFQDTAWDVSSDISVLHTMMAQDGLMKKDFPKEKR